MKEWYKMTNLLKYTIILEGKIFSSNQSSNQFSSLPLFSLQKINKLYHKFNDAPF